jgi:hypothetical protein
MISVHEGEKVQRSWGESVSTAVTASELVMVGKILKIEDILSLF